jgi:hypothetical protein
MLKYILLALALTSCGKFLDKFSRQEGARTEVRLTGSNLSAGNMDGGMMIYLVRQGGEKMGGVAVGASNSDLMQGKSVLVPNGDYKVYAIGSDGTSGQLLVGLAKCGYGNSGALLHFTGGSATVAIQMSAANCAFGTNSYFGDANQTNLPGNSFDVLQFQACGTAAYLTCDDNTGATFRVKFRLLAGEKPAGDAPMIEAPQGSLTSGCSSASSGGIVTSDFLAFVGSEEFSPPAEALIYADGTCSGAIQARLRFEDGMRDYMNVANGALIYVDQPASSDLTIIRFKYP